MTELREKIANAIMDNIGEGGFYIAADAVLAVLKEPGEDVIQAMARRMFASHWKDSDPVTFDNGHEFQRVFWAKKARSAIGALFGSDE